MKALEYPCIPGTLGGAKGYHLCRGKGGPGSSGLMTVETPCVKSGSPEWGESFLHHPLEGKAANSNACMPTDGKSTW